MNRWLASLWHTLLWSILFYAPLLAADHFSKVMAMNVLVRHKILSLFKINLMSIPMDFFLIPCHNHGVSFGLFHNMHVSPWFMIALMSVILVAIYIFYTPKDFWDQFGKHMVLAGGIGNIIDRYLWGYVFDFMTFSLGQWVFPVFNMADLMITLGGIMIFFRSTLEVHTKKNSLKK